MEFVEVVLLLVMVLIFIVILFNLFTYGRDLVIFPKMRRVSDEERYPGSPEYDEYTDDESDSDFDDYNDYDDNRRDRKSSGSPNPNKVAKYVSRHMENSAY